jgi:hypothetical protein
MQPKSSTLNKYEKQLPKLKPSGTLSPGAERPQLMRPELWFRLTWGPSGVRQRKHYVLAASRSLPTSCLTNQACGPTGDETHTGRDDSVLTLPHSKKNAKNTSYWHRISHILQIKRQVHMSTHARYQDTRIQISEFHFLQAVGPKPSPWGTSLHQNDQFEVSLVLDAQFSWPSPPHQV